MKLESTRLKKYFFHLRILKPVLYIGHSWNCLPLYLSLHLSKTSSDKKGIQLWYKGYAIQIVLIPRKNYSEENLKQTQFTLAWVLDEILKLRKDGELFEEE